MDTGAATASALALFSYALTMIIAALTAVLIRGIVAVLAGVQRRRISIMPTPVTVSVTPARDETAEHVAAVAAAVFAVLGAHRLVYIGEAQRGYGWTTEIRSRLHTSHTPRLDHH